MMVDEYWRRRLSDLMFLSLVGCFPLAVSMFPLARYLHSCTGALHINRSEVLLIEAHLLIDLLGPFHLFLPIFSRANVCS
jgi:hypothetical protein